MSVINPLKVMLKVKLVKKTLTIYFIYFEVVHLMVFIFISIILSNISTYIQIMAKVNIKNI